MTIPKGNPDTTGFPFFVFPFHIGVDRQRFLFEKDFFSGGMERIKIFLVFPGVAPVFSATLRKGEEVP